MQEPSTVDPINVQRFREIKSGGHFHCWFKAVPLSQLERAGCGCDGDPGAAAGHKAAHDGRRHGVRQQAPHAPLPRAGRVQGWRAARPRCLLLRQLHAVHRAHQVRVQDVTSPSCETFLECRHRLCVSCMSNAACTLPLCMASLEEQESPMRSFEVPSKDTFCTDQRVSPSQHGLCSAALFACDSHTITCSLSLWGAVPWYTPASLWCAHVVASQPWQSLRFAGRSLSNAEVICVPVTSCPHKEATCSRPVACRIWLRLMSLPASSEEARDFAGRTG